MAATLHRGDGHMAQKGRGIFMVYVDIDAQHVEEFNEWYNVRPRRGRCGVERLVQWGICARLSQGAGSNLRPPLSGPRWYQRLQHGLRICQYGGARKPG